MPFTPDYFVRPERRAYTVEYLSQYLYPAVASSPYHFSPECTQDRFYPEMVDVTAFMPRSPSISQPFV